MQFDTDQVGACTLKLLVHMVSTFKNDAYLRKPFPLLISFADTGKARENLNAVPEDLNAAPEDP